MNETFGGGQTKKELQNYLVGWLPDCPGNHESAGKRLSGKTRKGNPWLRKTLVEVANAAARTKNTYLSAQYHRLAARRGRKRALIALGHTILVIIYCILSQHQNYEELGAITLMSAIVTTRRNASCAGWRN